MSSGNEPKAVKKRSGRKRLPPLAPGPALQFVVASHPDDFKADDTMRHIRSHVMYKHRGNQEPRSESPPDMFTRRGRNKALSVSRTPSPMVTPTQSPFEDCNHFAPVSMRRSTVWDGEFHTLLSQSPCADPARELATRVIAATTAEPVPARSAPPAYNQNSEYPFPTSALVGTESLDHLRSLYVDRRDLVYDRAWMEVVVSTRMSFLSSVCTSCVYQDLHEGLLHDSPLTVYAKTKVLQMIKESLQEARTSANDITALSILHLLVSETGGFDEEVFDVHLEGLVRIVHQRGGLENLGIYGRLASFLTVVMLTFTVLRGHTEPGILHGYSPNRRQSAFMARPPPISPLFAPHGDLSALYGTCAADTYDILCDMYDLTHTFILRWDYVSDAYAQSSSQLASYDAHMQQIYTRLLLRPPTDTQGTPDWVYESCRLTALIYCRSIVQGIPLADSANVMHVPRTGMALSGTTMIMALHDALEHTNKTNNWGDLYGVFLWICLVGGAASWHSIVPPVYGQHDEAQTAAAWRRKSFSLFAVKTSLACGCQESGATIEAQRRMLRAQSLISLKQGLATQERALH